MVDFYSRVNCPHCGLGSREIGGRKDGEIKMEHVKREGRETEQEGKEYLRHPFISRSSYWALLYTNR